MNKQLSFGQYRTIDLTILAVLLGLSQAGIWLAATTVYADQLYVVSPVAAVTAIVMMRWGGWAAIHAALGGVLFAALAGGSWQQFLIYGLGNLAGLAGLLMLKLLGKEKIRQDALLSIAFGVLTQLSMLVGRALVAPVLGFTWEACLGFITTDALSILFTVCIVWVARRVEGLFEDQKHYLLRLEEERQSERRDQS